MDSCWLHCAVYIDQITFISALLNKAKSEEYQSIIRKRLLNLEYPVCVYHETLCVYLVPPLTRPLAIRTQHFSLPKSLVTVEKKSW